jgi:hypothetical protein
MCLSAVDIPLLGGDPPPLNCFRTPLLARDNITAPKCACGRLFVDALNFHVRGIRFHHQSLAFQADHRIPIIALPVEEFCGLISPFRNRALSCGHREP